MGRYYNPELKVLEDIPDSPMRVFCGEPAIGKTTSLRAYMNRLRQANGSGQGQSALLHVEFRSVPDLDTFKERTFRSSIWGEWQEGTHPLTLLVDGLDEGLVRIDRFLPFLTEELRQTPRERLRLVLVCRTMEWQHAWKQGEDLCALFPQPSSPGRHPEGISAWTYTLCPLRRKDVLLAARTEGLDAEVFLTAVAERGAASLAARPYTLRMLLSEFARKRTLGNSRRELYESYAARLCEEPNPERVDLLRKVYPAGSFPTKDVVYRVASRVAALLMLTGKDALFLGPSEDAATTDLAIREASPPDGNLSQPTFPDERTVRHALATALFTDRGINRLGFDHLTMAECLAARHMEGMPLIQLKELFCNRDAAGEYVHPQLASVAAWLAEGREDFFTHVLEVDPEVLLRSETAQLEPENRRRLVDKLLTMASRETLFDRKQLYYSGLGHPGLADQLRPWIRDKTQNWVVRRMALDIAAECQVAELFDEVLGLTSDPKEISTLGSPLAQALESLACKENITKVIPFARGEVAGDEKDQLKGAALQVLLKFGASVTEILPHLTPPRNSHFVGEYWMLLRHEIPKRVQDSDIVPLLEAALTWKSGWGSTFARGEIVHAAMEKGLQCLDDQHTSELVVRLWVESFPNHTHECLGAKECSVSTLLKDRPDLRRRFAERLLNSGHCPVSELWQWIGNADSALLCAEDVGWLLETISAVPSACTDRWAAAIAIAWDPEKCCRWWDLLLQKRKEVEALGKQFEWLREWKLDDPVVRKRKADWLRQKQRQRRWAKPAVKAPAPHERIIHWLTRAKTGDLDACGKIFETILSPEEGERALASVFLDIGGTPVWQGLSPNDQTEIRYVARWFLIEHNENEREPSSSITFCALTGLQAAYLLRETILTDEELKRAVCQQWIPVLVSGWGAQGHQHSELATLACELDRARTKECLRAEIIHGAKEGHVPLHTLHAFRDCWGPDLTELLFGLITTDALPDAARPILAEFTTEADPALALRCLAWARSPVSHNEKVRQEVAASIVSGFLAEAPGTHWSVLWPLVSSDAVVAERAMLRLAQAHSHRREGLDLKQLAPLQIGDLYRKLVALFPPETDPEIPNEVHTPTPRMEVARLRETLPETLARRATQEACDVLQALAQEFPSKRLWLHWRHHEATEMRRHHAWVPPSPQEVSLLLARSAARRVISSGEFLDVVLESLERLQRRLNASVNPLDDQFWRFSRVGARRENFSPQYEEDISGRIAAWLQDDLGGARPVVIGKEVQPVWSQKTDIQVTALPSGNPPGEKPLRVVIEVKGCWNPKVKTDLKTQLVDRYLTLDREAAGLYLVGWFVSDRWDDPADSRRKRQNALGSASYQDACRDVDALAVASSGGNANIRGLVMDFRLPA